jgi:hypothetical protein
MADEWCRKFHKIPYVEISAKDDKNVDHAFRVLLGNILNYIELLGTYDDHKRKPLNVVLDDNDRKKGCCY